MEHWADEFHLIALRITNAMSRPDVDASFLAKSGAKLDRALFPLLSRVGAFGPVGTVELADMVGRSHSTVSRQIAKLEEQGLIERLPSTDGRIRLLQPSSAGKRMLAEFARTRRRLIEAYFADWSEKDRNQLLALMKRAVQKIDGAAG